MANPRSDGALLKAHLTGDSVAFEELTRRHAGMVMETCRRLLGCGADAEDAAQATFMVLLRRAGALTDEGDVGGWLHRTAVLVSRNAARARRRQARHEKEAAVMRPASEAAPAEDRRWKELAGGLDQALDTLPAVQRRALVLCYFEGLSQSQAAARLGQPESTLATRCARGLERLRERLGSRERAPGAAALGALLLAHAAAAAPESLIGSVAAAAKGAAVGAPVLALTEGALKAMFWTKIKMVAAAVTAAALLGAVTPWVVRAASAEDASGAPGTAAQTGPADPTDGAKPGAPKADEPAAVDGLKVSLAADKSEARAGEEIKLTLTFENASREKLRVFWPVERYLGDQISLEASGDGVRRGAQMRDMMAMLPGLANYPELAPGEKKALEIRIAGNPPAVTRLAVHFTKEGTYKIRVRYAYKDENPQAFDNLQPGPVPGKVWRGTVESQEVEIKLSGEFKDMPGRGLLGPGGRLPAPRPMGQGMKVPEELMPDRNPQPAPGTLEDM